MATVPDNWIWAGLRTLLSDSKFYCESNGGIFVTRRLPVPEISRVGFQVEKGVWPTIFDDVIFWLKILLRIQRWYFRHQAASGSGDIQGRVPGRKGGVADNFRWRHFLIQNFTANRTMVFLSPGDFPFDWNLKLCMLCRTLCSIPFHGPCSRQLNLGWFENSIFAIYGQ